MAERQGFVIVRQNNAFLELQDWKILKYFLSMYDNQGWIAVKPR